MIALKIDVTKVEKARLFASNKSNAKYLDLVLFNNKDGKDQYGNDGFVKQGCTPEERQNGVQMPIIGNWRHLSAGKNPGTPAAPKPANAAAEDDSDSVPF